MPLPDLPPVAVETARYFGWLALTIVPLFVVASFLVGLAREYASADRVRASLESRDGGTGNLAAAGLGAVTPFCSCSSIPLVAGLLQAGAPLGIVFSFLLASPLVNEIAVPLLAVLFGWKVAALYVGLMLAAAVLGGLALGRLFDFEDHVNTDSLSTFDAGPPAMTDGGAVTAGLTPTGHRAKVRRAGAHSVTFLREMLPYVGAGLVVAALVHGVVPVSLLRGVLGPGNPLAVPLAVLAGVPLYFSLSATLPVAHALAAEGIPIGTVLALLVGVVGVSLPEMVMLSKLFGRRLLAAYVGTVVVVGLVVGVVFNALPL